VQIAYALNLENIITMKLNLIILICFVSFISIAQNNKGKFFVETGAKISGDGDYYNFGGKTGITINKSTRYWKFLEPDDVQSDSQTGWSYSFAPRVGIYLSEKITGGVDFQYYNSKNRSTFYEFYDAYRITAGGVFLRYYFSDKKTAPFLEAKTGIGISKSHTEEKSAGGGDFTSTKYQNLFYYALNAGISFRLNDAIKLNLSAMSQNTMEKFSDKSSFDTNTFKISNWELVPMLSLTYIFNNKKEKLK